MALSAFGSGLLQGGLLRVASSSPCGVLGLALLHARGAVQQWACSSRAAAPAGPAAAAVWLQQAAPLSTAAAAGWEEAPFRVSDLIDAHSGPWGSPEQQASPLQVLRPGLRNFGGKKTFFGQVSTIKCLDSNVLVHEAVKEAGKGRVLVIDAGSSLQSSVIGDILARVAKKHGWEGVVINGCIRDAATLPQLPLGIKALATSPMRPGKGDVGQRDVPVVVGGVAIAPGDWLYSDEDGILLSPSELEMPDTDQLAELKKSYGL